MAYKMISCVKFILALSYYRIFGKLMQQDDPFGLSAFLGPVFMQGQRAIRMNTDGHGKKNVSFCI